MKYNEILEAIYRSREEHARECDFDIHQIFAQLRADTERHQAESWPTVAPTPRAAETSFVLQDEPPKP